MSNWREAEARKKAEAEARQAEEDRKKREVLAQVKAEAEQNAGPRAAGEIRVARNEGEAARFGGGGESSWKQQDKVLGSLDQLDSMFNEVLK